MNYSAEEKRVKIKGSLTQKELAHRLELLIINTEEPFILVNTDLEIVSFNKQFEGLYLKYFHRQISKGDSILAHSQNRSGQELKEIYNTTLSGYPQQSEIEVVGPENQTLTFSAKYKPAFDENKTIIGVFVSIEDITEKKRTQHLLNANENRFRALVEHSGDMISLTDGEGKILYLSPSFEKITGFSLERMKGKTAFEIMHPDFREEAKLIFEELLAKPGVPIPRKSRFLNNKTGNYMYVEGITTNLLANENVQAIVANFKDVTERILAKEKLEQAESRFKKLIEHNYDGIVLRDENFSIIYSSASSERILGWTAVDKLGNSFSDKTHPDDIEKVKENHQNVLKNPGISFPLIFRTQHKDGHYVWVERVLTNMLHDTSINAIVANFRDITEKITAEQEKEFDHSNLHALINNTNDLMWSISIEGKLISSNRAFDEMVKYMSGNAVTKGGDAPTDGFPKEQLKKWEQLYARAFAGETFTIVEYTNVHEEYWSEISFYPICKGEEIIGTACYSRNITDRKLFERKLEENTSELLLIKKELEHNASRLKQAQAIAHVGHWEINFGTNVSAWSDEAYRIYGLDPAEHSFSFEEWKKFIHPEDLHAFENEMKRARETSSDSVYSHRILRRDGSVRYIVSQSRHEFNSIGEAIGLYGIVHDITEQKESEKKLKTSHELLKKLTDKVPLAVYQFEMDKEGKMTFPFISKAIEQLLPQVHLNTLDLDATSLFQATHPKDLAQLIGSVEESRSNLSDWNIEFRILLPDNSIKWLRGFSKPEAKENDTVVWYGYLQDITEKKIANQEIRIAKERYDFVAKATNDAIYDWDLITNTTVRTGDGLKTLFGYDPEFASTEPHFWTKRMHPDDYKIAYSILKKLLLDPKANYCNQEYRFMRADSTYAYVYDKGFIIRDSKGKAVRMIGATQDITQNKEAEFKLKELNERLEKRARELVISNAELEQFAYIASHDLQEPLRMVTSFLTQLENKYEAHLDDRAKQYIHFATDGAVRMRRLILDLLEYSRVGRQLNTTECVDTNELLPEAIKLNKVAIDEKNAVIDWKNLPVINASKTTLLQVFQNLIGNALKYQKTGTTPLITITCAETESHWQFAISDNGIGIEERYFEKIFVVFQRLHNKDEYSGTGIGLAICKKIVENHQGRIWVESTYGIGSTFYFTISKN